MKSKVPGKSDPASQLVSSEKESARPRISCDPAPNKITFKEILVPVDFSDCSLTALEYALALAGKLGSRVTLLHVVEPALYPQNSFSVTPAVDEANQTLMSSGRERLAALKERLATERLAIETLVRVGRAQSEISDTANAMGSDLIVMGTHGDAGLKQVLLGGTAERVVRQASCPVLTVRHL